MQTWAIIMAAGSSRRMQGENKLMLSLGGKQVLRRTLEAVCAFDRLNGVCVVCNSSEVNTMYERIRDYRLEGRVLVVAEGGETRGQSVLRGLCAISEYKPDIVMVHDGARPLVDRATLEACLQSAEQHGSGVAANRITDTVHRVTNGLSAGIEPREELMTAQTPQAFRYAELLAAYERAEREGISVTDDAAVMLLAGHDVRLVQTSASNKKLTYPADFRVMEALVTMNEGELRVGHGYDAHRLRPGRALMLCGTQIPFERGLDGHSDADVATHALMDALLGAAGMGDIGRHFPDSDESYKGICSITLLKRVKDLLNEKGFAPHNVDITIVAQAPKLAAYMPSMVSNIAEALNLPKDNVNVKATTTERMGFEGAGEGISATAVALLRRIF